MANTPPLPGGPETATALITTTAGSRFSPTMSLDDLTADYLKNNYLTGFKFQGADCQELPPVFFDEKLSNAIAKLEEITHIDVLQRTVIGEKHDYFTTDYLNYAFMQLYRVPAQSVSVVRAVYPTGQTIQMFPSEWVRLSVEHGQFNLVPTSGTLSQIMVGAGNGFLPFIFAGVSYMPQLWEVDYISGFAPDSIPRNVISVICKLAAIEILTIMSNLVGPLGQASSSISVDGLSQSISRQLPAFRATIDAYKVDLGIPGPALAIDPKYNSGEIGQLRRTYFGMALASL
jgi:hypothetical protein